MIYSTILTVKYTISYFLIIVLSCLHSNFSPYLQYVIGLNFWSINLLSFSTILLIFFAANRYKYSWAFYKIILLKVLFPGKVFFNVFLKKKLIKTLWVGTILIHPVIFYSSLVLLIVLAHQSKVLNTLLSFFFKKSELTLFLAVALILGGVWGLQSLTWGYIWVNDGIEWLLFTLILYSFVGYHIKSVNIATTSILFNLYLLLNVLIFIRLNIITTRHSFMSNFSLVYILLTIGLYCSYAVTQVLTSQKLCCQIKAYAGLSSLLYIFVLFTNYNTYLLKYTFSVGFYFYVYTVHSFMFSRKALAHFMIFVFFSVWSACYTYFFLSFNDGFRFSFSELAFFEGGALFSQSYSNPTWLSYLLERVSFNCFDFSINVSTLKLVLNFVIIFNNYLSLTIIYTLLLLKRFESGLLHKKKTRF